MLVSVFSVGAFATETETSGTYGEGVEWSLSPFGTLTISGNGAMADKTSSEEAPWGTGIKEVIIRNGITSIGNYAFSEQTVIWRVIIPDSVKSIGMGAFYKCSNLQDVTMPSQLDFLGEFAFCLCTSLKKISIPNGIKEIKKYSFSKCTALTSIVIPDSVTAICECAFFKCEDLGIIKFNDSLETIGNSVFWGCAVETLYFGNNLKSIGELAFTECKSLYYVQFPESLKEIGQSAFYDCYLLKSISVPESVETIGSQALGYNFVTAQGSRHVEGFSMKVVRGSAGHTYALDNNLPNFVVEGKPKLPEADSKEFMDSQNNTMPNVIENTKASALISNLAEYGLEATVFDKEENELSFDSSVGTGCKVVISDGSEYTVIVKGDVDGTGVVDSTDYLKIKAVFLHTEKLENAYLVAADADGNAVINSTDYLRIKSYFIGGIDLYA